MSFNHIQSLYLLSMYSNKNPHEKKVGKKYPFRDFIAKCQTYQLGPPKSRFFDSLLNFLDNVPLLEAGNLV